MTELTTEAIGGRGGVPQGLRSVGFLACVAAGVVGVQGQFAFTTEDLLLGFRDNAAANNLVVNLGDRDTFRTQSGVKFDLPQVNAALLATAFADLNQLRVSGFSATRPGDADTLADNTLWLTRPRSVNSTQTTPWNRSSNTAQGNVSSRVRAVGNNSLVAGVGGGNPADSVVTTEASSLSYRTQVGASGNWNNTFQGSVELVTGATFSTGGVPARLDLYELVSGSGAGQYLGYFELSTSGDMSFTPVPEPEHYALATAGFLVALKMWRQRQRRVGQTV